MMVVNWNTNFLYLQDIINFVKSHTKLWFAVVTCERVRTSSLAFD